MRKMLRIPAVTVLALVLLLAGVLAQDAAGLTGKAEAENAAPTVTSVALTGGAMTPQTEATLTVGVSDPDTLADINRIEIIVFHDTSAGAGSPGGFSGFDADEKALFKWVPADTWTMEKGGVATTTWAIGTCVTPTLTETSGDFVLKFTPGKLAKAASGEDTDEWNVYVRAYDAALDDDASEVGNSMAYYDELSLDPDAVDFGTVPLGGSGTAIQTPGGHILTVKVLSNAAHALGISAANWTGGGKTLTLDPDGAEVADGCYSLCVDDAGDGNGYPSTPQWVTGADVTIDGCDSLPAQSTSAGESEATADKGFYLGIKLGTGIYPVTYSGTITITLSAS